MQVAPGTIVLWSDIGCPWAHVAVSRLHRSRAELGLDDRVRIDHRPFPLELFNERPTPYPVLAGEVPVLHALDPDAGWQVWKAPSWEWPVTTLPALEAVQAAKRQSLAASEQLDRALRRALFADSRCVSLRTVVLEVASTCDAVDVDTLAAAVDAGAGRAEVIEGWRTASDLGVQGSPHVFLADGGDAHNPGITMHKAHGMPVVDHDDPGVYADLVKRASEASPGPTK